MTRIACLLATALFLSLTGCSSFESEYSKAAATTLPADSIEGPWVGRWESQAGHGNGPLRAMVSKTGPDIYFARFRAGYWGVFEAGEETLLRVKSTNPVKATGESDLGYIKGGMYKYEATVTPTKFDATYQSAGDRGIFTLTRPTAENK
jgi:hypothetical protein